MNKPQLLSMKQHGARVKLTISIGAITSDCRIHSEEYNIYNFVLVSFRSDGRPRERDCDLQINKHELAKGLTITINVFVGSKAVAEICCSEDWSGWNEICGWTKQEIIGVDLIVTVTKIQSIINRKLYKDDTFTDFQLSAEDGSVAVHRAHLAAHSDMFKTMLSGQWKETTEGRVELKGITRQALEHFKEYMYLGTFPNNDDDGTDTLCQLLLLAELYLIEDFRAECTMKLIQKITAENYNKLLEFAIENKLEEFLHNMIEKTPENILASTLEMKMKALMYKKEGEE